MTNEEHIEELLLEANAYGVREQLIKIATSLQVERPHADRCWAFEEAFKVLIDGQV